MDRAALAQVRTIVAHENCADGTASAILLHDALPHCEVIFADYGRDADRLPARDGMLFCDFSPPPERVDEFVAAKAIVLDHHRSAREVIARFGEWGIYADEEKDPGVSGATLAFREVWLPLRGDSAERGFAEAFATAAGARDTWHTASPSWQAGCVQQSVLTTFGQRYWLTIPLSTLATDWATRYVPMGEQVLSRKRARLVDTIRQGYRFTTRRGLRVLAMNSLGSASDAAGEADVDLVIAFDIVVDEGHLRMRMSLRSHTGFDCAAFATAHGGGGHTRAAGCAIRVGPEDPQPYRLLERLLADSDAPPR